MRRIARGAHFSRKFDIRLQAGCHLESSVFPLATSHPKRQADFDLYVSEFVVVEASRGNEEAAARRLSVIAGIAELRVTEDTRNLAEALINDGSLPLKAEIDAFHVAVAAANGINYLLTWNCTHIANAVMRPRIEAVCRRHGFEPPIICTPSELLEG